jgi:hypothetical protein
LQQKDKNDSVLYIFTAVYNVTFLILGGLVVPRVTIVGGFVNTNQPRENLEDVRKNAFPTETSILLISVFPLAL